MASTHAKDLRKLSLYFFLITGTTGFLQPFMPLYLSASGVKNGQIGLITGLGIGLALVIQPALGRLSDRFDSRKPFIFACAFTAAAAYFCFPYAHTPLAFLALVALGSNGTTYLNAVGGVLVGRMVAAGSPKTLAGGGGGAAYGGVRLWGSVGYIITTIVTGLIVNRPTSSGSKSISLDRAALDPIFHYGPVMFLGVVALAAFLPDRPKIDPMPKPASASAKAPFPKNLKRFLAAYFFYNFALYGASGFLSLYLKSLGADGPQITATFAAGVVVEVLVMRWSGRFSDRFGRRPTLAISFLLLPVRLLLYVPATGPLWVLGVQSLHGLNFGIMGAVAVTFANDLATDHNRGHAQARLFAILGLASAAGPILLGSVVDASSLRAMFAVAALFGAVGTAIFMFGVEDSHPTSESLADKAPRFLRHSLRWLDAPP